ncbi:dipeptidase [Amycolatopsis japonica]|uniref:dipeptidase n=1 Tax=Amycolatopsis japonica TaxID=208439 RepID=UPI00366ACA64
MSNWKISPEAASLHANSLVCDTTLPWMEYTDNKAGVLERFRDAGFNFVSLTVATDSNSLSGTVRYIAQVKSCLEQRGDVLFVKSAADIRAAKAQDKLAVGFNFQGTGCLEGNIDMVAAYYDLGVRQMLFTYNKKNLAGGGCHDDPDTGLTPFGASMVREMNRLGMIVDCTHMGSVSSMEAMQISQLPCVFSHSNSRVVHDHERNLSDAQAKVCAATGGIIGMNGVSVFLSADGDASVEAMLRHIDHFADLVGPEHLGIGLDFVYYEEQMYRLIAARPELFSKGYPPPPFKYFAPEDLPRLTEALLKRGYGEDDIRGLLGENYLRVCQAVMG